VNFDAPFVEVLQINSDISIAILDKIEARNQDKSKIPVIRDNTPYHKCSRSENGCRDPIVAFTCPVSNLLPPPEPDRETMGRDAQTRHSQQILPTPEKIHTRHSCILPPNHSKGVAKLPQQRGRQFQNNLTPELSDFGTGWNYFLYLQAHARTWRRKYLIQGLAFVCRI